ncbi:MAG TPA: hypothetical protein VF940_02485 [Streptosporangiaceae bacterium]
MAILLSRGDRELDYTRRIDPGTDWSNGKQLARWSLSVPGADVQVARSVLALRIHAGQA